MKIQQGTALSYVARVALFSFVLAPISLMAQQSDPSAPPPSTQDGGPLPRGPHGDPAERQAHMLQMMTKRLNLSPDQVTQIKAIQADNETQMQGIHSDTSLQPADRRAKMMDLHKAESDKIHAVLNDDQKAKYDAMEAKRHDRMRGDHGGPPPSGQDAPPPPPPAQ